MATKETKTKATKPQPSSAPAPAPAASGSQPKAEKPTAFDSETLREFYWSKPEAEADLDGGGWEWKHFFPYHMVERLHQLVGTEELVSNNVMFGLLVGNDGSRQNCVLCNRKFQPKWSMVLDGRGLRTEEGIELIKDEERRQRAFRDLKAFQRRTARVTVDGMKRVGLLKNISLSDYEARYLDYFSTCGHPKEPWSSVPRLRGHFVLMGEKLEPRPHCGCFFFRDKNPHTDRMAWMPAKSGCVNKTVRQQLDEYAHLGIYFFSWPSFTVKVHRAIVLAQYARLEKNEAQLAQHGKDAVTLFKKKDFRKDVHRVRGGLEVRDE